MTKADYIKILLGKRIKELRIQKKMTQEKMSEIVGIGERNLSKIECGANFISAETLVKISDALNVEPHEIFNFKHLNNVELLRQELINAIQKDETDIKLMYKFYKAIK